MSRITRHQRRLLAPVGALLLLVAAALGPLSQIVLPVSLLGPQPVAAQSVPQLSGQVTDEAGVVGGNRGQLDQALADLLDRHNVQLYLAFIPTTDGGSAPSLAQSTFQQNGLGGNDLLLLVAVNDHRYGWWRDSGSAAPSISKDQLDQMLSRTIEPRFRAGDYAGGVVDFANALGDQLAAPPGVVTPQSPSPVPASQPVDTSWIGWLLGLLLIAAGAFVVWVRWNRWRLDRRAAEERDRRTGELARQANSLLIRADDAAHEAQQELGFAEAEFDASDVQPFRDAIGQSQTELKAAFAIRQQLDDDVPEDPETRERMLAEIVDRCKKAGSLVDEQRRRIHELRDLERTAPDVLAQMPARIADQEARLPAVEATIASLQAYAAASWQPVKGNAEEARKRIAAAGEQVKLGTAALAASPVDTRTAAGSARRAQIALAQATALLAAVDRLAATIEQARARLDGELADADKDIGAARQTLSGPRADPALTAKLATAVTLLEGAKQQATAQPPDVLGADRDAQRAHAAADDVLAGLRAAEDQQARAEAAMNSALQTAEASIDRARDFIATRRNGVRREARTRLAEAQRHVDQARALVPTDQAQATSEARLAGRLGDEAYDLARSDFDDWDIRGGRRGNNDLAGAILGGIVLGGILGGGRRGGGWGGTPWGAPWGGGSGGGGGFGGFGGFGGGQGGGGGWGGGGGGGQGGGGSW